MTIVRDALVQVIAHSDFETDGCNEYCEINYPRVPLKDHFFLKDNMGKKLHVSSSPKKWMARNYVEKNT